MFQSQIPEAHSKLSFDSIQGDAATNKLLCLKKANSQISMFFTSNEERHQWQLKDQNLGGRFAPTS